MPNKLAITDSGTRRAEAKGFLRADRTVGRMFTLARRSDGGEIGDIETRLRRQRVRRTGPRIAALAVSGLETVCSHEQVLDRLPRHSICAIDALQLDVRDVGTVVSSSRLYSLGCPTLAHRLVDHYEMYPTTDNYHVTGVAGASAVPLMRLTALPLREHRTSRR